jgi:hypothetical protein
MVVLRVVFDLLSGLLFPLPCWSSDCLYYILGSKNQLHHFKEKEIYICQLYLEHYTQANIAIQLLPSHNQQQLVLQ